ncbi:hypothetical protein BAUCODRAFT_119358 [Baudoinia panamericana UAMH 10762]|uniref:DUF7165 domain-containing protein n=1 Tax=Baudoinia panamericana (strain UAMH 10762) TaxID=717646 RepID=M2N6R3_BAUPA|nr:uncharacterized protein BAUCODRAFT_119358 [Baudoinia panamericana UAMH 10762]EMC99783.1 hypothetical protein BAUCODRAFT_119358 [Baudoinia panamericana UAMH 10762]
MPVSTFSSGNAEIRSGHGAMIARWNSTRERIQEDERKMSVSEINEMDGSGLHNQPDWPLRNLPERSVSPEPVQRGDVDEAAVVRRGKDVMSSSPDPGWKDGEVSDLDEDDLEVGDARAEPTLGPDARRQLQAHLTAPLKYQAAASPVGLDRERPPHALLGGATHSALGKGKVRSLQPTPATPPDVSPFLQQSWQSPPTQSAHSNGHHLFEEAAHGADPFVQPWAHQTTADDGDDEEDEEDDEFEDEARDMATPIALAETTSPQTLSPAIASPSSSRLSTHQTTQIPSHKDRVRYSWQSLQDDEPNRPRIHIIKLVSEVATASAGFPGGEAFGFSISPGGRRIAAYNSARLYVLQTAALPVGISQDYALKRRPLAVEIVDEGNAMAILADEHTINIYDLGHQRLRRTKTIKTDFPTNCIALAPTGGLLAAAYEGGVEIFSLDPGALPTDRRAVRSQKMDRLTFSEDGSTLLGTTTRINVSSTVVVSVPVFPAAPNGIPTHEELREAWCADLLHPENIRNSSHAMFMRENRQNCNDRVFAWNGLADTFGILNIGDMQYGNIDFPVVISPPLSTCGGLGAAIHSCPAIDEYGDTIAMIVNDRTIRLYIVPHKVGDDETTVEAHSIDHELDEGYGCPFSEARWVYSTANLPAPRMHQNGVQGRLIVTSPGGVVEQEMGEEMVDDIEGGRIILFDFDPQFAGQPGQTFSLTLGKSQPQMLEEEQVDVADAVALVRRRTVNQTKSGGLSQRPVTLGRAATTFGGGNRVPMRSPSSGFTSRGSNRNSLLSIGSVQSEASRSLPHLAEGNENGEVFEEPYAQNAPRSRASMQRAASNAQRHRYQTLEERNQERVSVDSSGNFLPLPEYTEEPNAPLPSRFRAMAGLDAPLQAPSKPSIVTSANGSTPSSASTLPLTAPAAIAENFSAEEAFRTAAATYAVASQRRQDAIPATMRNPSATMPARSETFNSINSMPRSLQRAYSNAISPLGSGPAPTAVPENVPWDAIMPAVPRPPPPSTPFSRAQHASGNPYRYSTSLLNPPGHGPIPNRAPSTSSSMATSSISPSPPPGSAGGVSTARRLPPHMEAFRTAAASASLFPPTQSADHVPLRAPPEKVGSVAHPITAWHPPAASATGLQPPGSARGHSRKSSLSNKTAFASTDRAKKLGFFKRKKSMNLMPGGYPDDQMNGGGNESLLETKSMATWRSRGDGKCIVM